MVVWCCVSWIWCNYFKVISRWMFIFLYSLLKSAWLLLTSENVQTSAEKAAWLLYRSCAETTANIEFLPSQTCFLSFPDMILSLPFVPFTHTNTHIHTCLSAYANANNCDCLKPCHSWRALSNPTEGLHWGLQRTSPSPYLALYSSYLLFQRCFIKPSSPQVLILNVWILILARSCTRLVYQRRVVSIESRTNLAVPKWACHFLCLCPDNHLSMFDLLIACCHITCSVVFLIWSDFNL